MKVVKNNKNESCIEFGEEKSACGIRDLNWNNVFQVLMVLISYLGKAFYIC
jgi:hypothetical protein